MEGRADPEVRLDQLTGLRTILSPARADRPFDFGGVPIDDDRRGAENCAFCEGREDRTPPETWADRPGGGGPDTPGWRVRAVPNLYAALSQTHEVSGQPADETGGVTPAAIPCAQRPAGPSRICSAPRRRADSTR